MCDQNQETLQLNFRQSPRKQRTAWSPRREPSFIPRKHHHFISIVIDIKLSNLEYRVPLCQLAFTHAHALLSRLLHFAEAVLIFLPEIFLLPRSWWFSPSLPYRNFTPSLLYLHMLQFSHPLPDGGFARSSATSWQPLLLNCS